MEDPARDNEPDVERAALRGEVTRLINRLRDGAGGDDDLSRLVYDELHRVARSFMRRTPAGNTLQPTALVNEAYMRLRQGDWDWNSRGHFFCAAGEAMRQILVEQVRRKSTLKRGGDRDRVELRDYEMEEPSDDVLAVHHALSRLESRDPVHARIVKLRYFVGMTREETAAALDMSLRTLDRQWKFIVAWLHQAMAEPETPPEPTGGV